MAAGLLAHLLPADLSNRISITSAGTHGLYGYPAEPYAIEAMAELSIDIRGHRARQIKRNMAREADLILTMTTAHTRIVNRLLKRRQAPPQLISEFNTRSAAIDIEDPYGLPLSAYRHCIQVLQPCVQGVILWLGDSM